MKTILKLLTVGSMVLTTVICASAEPKLPTLGTYYTVYSDHDINGYAPPPDFNYEDPTSPEGFAKTDQGYGGYYTYYLEQGTTYNYNVVVGFGADKAISQVLFRRLQGAHGRYFSQDEVNYLMAHTASGKAFREVPNFYSSHCAGGLWKLYRSIDGRMEATVNYTLEAGQLEASSVQIHFLHCD